MPIQSTVLNSHFSYVFGALKNEQLRTKTGLATIGEIDQMLRATIEAQPPLPNALTKAYEF